MTAFCKPRDDFRSASKVNLGGRGKLMNTCESLIHPDNRKPVMMSLKRFLSGNCRSSSISLKINKRLPWRTCLMCSPSSSLRLRSSFSISFALATHLLKKESLQSSNAQAWCFRLVSNSSSSCSDPAYGRNLGCPTCAAFLTKSQDSLGYQKSQAQPLSLCSLIALQIHQRFTCQIGNPLVTPSKKFSVSDPSAFCKPR